MANEASQLLDWVRRVLEAALRGRPHPEPQGLPSSCASPQGCFVTLTRKGALRGCIGHLQPRLPLGEALAECARATAFEDARFPPLTLEEWPELDLEISLLGPLLPLEPQAPEALIRSLRPQIDGVWLEAGARRATFLPQVWAQLPDPEAFLTQLSRKAGGPDDLWRRPSTRFHTYTVTTFHGPAIP